MEYCYSLRYVEDNNKVIISEYDPDIMPSTAAIDDGDFCVSRSKENIEKIAAAIFPGKEIEFYSWED